MSAIMNYVEDKQTSEFYPTPEYLVEKMIEDVDWRFVETVLEPSAGKGDILKVIARKLCNRRECPEVDCIEIDGNLRQILKHNFSEEAQHEIRAKKKAITEKYSKYVEKAWDTHKYHYYDSEKRMKVNVRHKDQKELEKLDEELEGFFNKDIYVVHDDFLTYEAYKKYDLIIMNPPFSCGDKHLLKALNIQKNGGGIICLLNAETIRNPFTESRRQLVKLLNEYNASVEYIDNAFASAERTAQVDVALIKVFIPENDSEMSIFDKLAEAKEYEEPTPEESTELEISDFIKAEVSHYQIEVEAGIELIKTYNRMLPYLNTSFDSKEYGFSKPIIELTDGNSHEMTINRYVKAVRLKYWKALLTNEKFIGRLTSKLQHEYREKVHSFANYDFSEFNIRTLVVEINSQVKSGIESEIMTMYDKLTEEHAYYPECTKNRHLYDGWKTNKAWKLDKKSIIPCYGIFDRWDGKPRTYEAYGLLADIERIFNFFDGNMTAEIDLSRQLDLNFRNGITKNIQCKYFNVTFYKKGTVHITYTCPELIDRFNIYAAQNKKWLPPSYGKKQYKDMTSEEKAVIDSFQGEKAYNKVLDRKDYYLASPTGNTRQFLAIAG